MQKLDLSIDSRLGS
jgi:hypothetical protein